MYMTVSILLLIAVPVFFDVVRTVRYVLVLRYPVCPLKHVAAVNGHKRSLVGAHSLIPPVCPKTHLRGTRAVHHPVGRRYVKRNKTGGPCFSRKLTTTVDVASMHQVRVTMLRFHCRLLHWMSKMLAVPMEQSSMKWSIVAQRALMQRHHCRTARSLKER